MLRDRTSYLQRTQAKLQRMRTLVAYLVVGCLSLFSDRVVQGVSYQFDRIAISGPGAIDDLRFYSLNNSGQVAFNAIHPDGGMSIYRWSQGQTEILVQEGDLYSGSTLAVPTRPAINDAGAIAFSALQYAGHLAGSEGVFRLDGQSLTKIAPLSTTGRVASTSLDISNSGLVAFNDHAASGRKLSIGDGVMTQPVLVGDNLQITPTYVAINSSNTIAVTGIGSQHKLVLVDGQNQTVIASGTSSIAFESISFPCINSAGKIVFAGEGDLGRTLYAYEAGQLSRVINLAESDFLLIDGAAGINDLDQILFFARLNDGRHGLFTGPDATSDKILLSGDFFDGRTIDHLGTAGQLNNVGQLVFAAYFTDGEVGLYLATSVAEPSVGSLCSLLPLAIIFFARKRRAGLRLANSRVSAGLAYVTNRFLRDRGRIFR
jgi:hypothetical protein